jgi:hypothetical protein
VRKRKGPCAKVSSRIDGLEETDLDDGTYLDADTLEEAEGEALGMGPPDGANFIKILDEGRVVKRLGFGL